MLIFSSLSTPLYPLSTLCKIPQQMEVSKEMVGLLVRKKELPAGWLLAAGLHSSTPPPSEEGGGRIPSALRKALPVVDCCARGCEHWASCVCARMCVWVGIRDTTQRFWR